MYANIVTALLRREQTGTGSHVHTSLLANGLWSASCLAQAALAGADLDGYSERRARAYTHVPYQTSDGRWLVFSMVRTPEHLDLMFAVAGLTEILIDDRFEPLSSYAECAQLFVTNRTSIMTNLGAFLSCDIT